MDSGNTSWILTSTALVMLMTPGLAFFYSGAGGKKWVLSTMMSSLLSLAIVSVQWFFWGYSLSFAESDSGFIGDLRYMGLKDIADGAPHPNAPTIPHVVYMIYQCMFAVVTPAIAFGAAVERARLVPYMLFLVLWSTLVYDVIAYWTWAPKGWLREMGALDFAGGTAVHISSGFAGLAYCMVVGPRKDKKGANNPVYVILGTGLLWFGWLGFNGGSAAAANSRAGNAILVTHLTAAWSGIVWLCVDLAMTGKMNAVGFCNGAVAGLVAVTPASGYIEAPSCLAFGFCGAVCCYFACKAKEKLKYDDALDCLGVHGVGGFIGNILTGIFASKNIVALDGTCTSKNDVPLCTPGGWVNDYYIQVPIQILSSVVVALYSFVLTYLILTILNKIPRCHLRASEDDELVGLDVVEIGQTAYPYLDDIQPIMLPDFLQAESCACKVRSWAYSKSASPSNSSSGSGDGSVRGDDEQCCNRARATQSENANLGCSSPQIMTQTRESSSSSIPRELLAMFDHHQLVLWIGSLDMPHVVDKVKGDKVIGHDIVSADADGMIAYFGPAEAQKILQSIQ